jgi:hypothetical protein
LSDAVYQRAHPGMRGELFLDRGEHDVVGDRDDPVPQPTAGVWGSETLSRL